MSYGLFFSITLAASLFSRYTKMASRRLSSLRRSSPKTSISSSTSRSRIPSSSSRPSIYFKTLYFLLNLKIEDPSLNRLHSTAVAAAPAPPPPAAKEGGGGGKIVDEYTGKGITPSRWNLICVRCSEEIAELWMEYEANYSREAKFVKDLDKVEMILQALEYEDEQGKDLDEFFQSTAGKFQTEVGKAWASEIVSRRRKNN